MKFEYTYNNLSLRILSSDSAWEVLDFYESNREYFDKYETDKPDNFYTIPYIRNMLSAEYNSCISGKYFRFFLFDRDVPDTIIGTISFSGIQNGCFNSCHTGYKIDHRFWNKGYARKMLTFAFKIMVTEHNMHRIEAYISPDNESSIALVNSMGFVNEGIAYSYVYMRGGWQDHLRYVYIS